MAITAAVMIILLPMICIAIPSAVIIGRIRDLYTVSGLFSARALLLFFKDTAAIGKGCLLALVLTEMVIHPVLDRVGQILLLNIMIGIVVGIKVMLTLDLCVLTIAVLVLEMTWKVAAFFGAHVLKGGIYRHIARI